MTDELIAERTNGIATFRFNRPDALNAITPPMLATLADGVEAAAADDSVDVVVLRGTGRAFSAGVDLKALNQATNEGGSVGPLLDDPARRVTSALSTMDKVTIAAVNGHCFTGALELALACDIVLVADEAKLGDTHAKWGLRPTWGMSQRLPALVGLARARELSYTARVFSGAEAAQWGLAARSAPAAEFDAALDQLLAEVTANSPGSRAAYKDLYGVAEAGLADRLGYEYATKYDISDSAERLGQF